MREYMNTSNFHETGSADEALIEAEKKERRPRRSKITLRRDVLDAVAYLVAKDGFSNINLASIARESGVNVNAILRNFTSLDRLLDRYAQIYEYWYDDIIKKSCKSESQDESQFYCNILKTITESMYQDKDVRHLMLWEMTEDNETTQRVAYNREYVYHKIINEYETMFKNSGLDIDVITALIIGGINYLIFRRKRTRFLGVDYSTNIGKERLLKTITDVVGLVFSFMNEQKEMLSTAKKLKSRGVDTFIIADCCGMDIETVEAMS